MEENKYKLAGYLAIVQAILFPVSVVLAILEMVAAKELFNIRRPFIGPTDLLMVTFTVIAVYTLLKFRQLLHERYQYHDLDLLIMISIWWAIMFQAIGLGLAILTSILWPVDKVLFVLVYLVFMTGAMVTIGIVDILIAVKLLRIKENFGEYIRAFAYITMAAGICEVTVLLSPMALVMVPVSAIVLALIFFRDQQEVEFV
ncbi:MAG: hypothetical protein HRF51_10270 [bacterium]|jgi:archaellum biogenesis protein FlaJ (TadC family)